MPIHRLALLIAIASTAFAADAPRQHGIETGDLDRAADPCRDFYQFANGTWRARNPIPAYMPRWSRRWAAGETNKDHLREILDEVSRKPDWPRGSVEQLVGDFQAACMDEGRADKLGITPLEPLLAEIEASKSPADVQRMITALHDLGISAPFSVDSGADFHHPTRAIAQVSAAGLGLPDRDYYLKPDARFKEARQRYRAHLARMFELAGRRGAAADAVLRLETALARASLDRAARRDPRSRDHKMPVSDLQKLTPHFDWAAYIARTGVPSDDLNVEQPKFMQEVERQLAHTRAADWRSYLAWHLLHSAADALAAPFVEEDFRFYGQFLQGAKEAKPRWKRCAEAADALLGEALGKKYVERYFPPEAKARMEEMVRNLRLAMKQTIDGLTWMTPETKKKALAKLATFDPKIGYPDRWKDYSRIAISRTDYWSDQVNARQWNVADDRAQMGKPVDRKRWGMTPPTSDAYYNPLQNEIVFPAGILQPPAFDMRATDAANYGAIGVVIGHEISHGFDDQGAKFDAQGRLENWWTDTDLKQFQQRGQCVVSQFEGYDIEPGIHHQGKLVLGEAIGDLAGAKIAHLAYKLSQEGKAPPPTVDGFTPDQQFFIAWGQFRGDEIRPETQRLMVQSDPHPIAKFRVLGPLSNLPEFQQAFSCKAGSPMVRPPAQRCEVW